MLRPVLLVLVLSSIGFGQDAQAPIERFEEADLPKWATISRVATDFEEFKLSSDQYDALKANESEHFGRYSHRQKAAYKDYLDEVYDVLNEKQIVRLHQIMFQRWMNVDDIRTGVLAFAPKEIDGLDAKATKLEEEIKQRLDDTIADLPDELKSTQKPLVEFLAWRWKKQTEWLRSELGPVRVKELIGKPVPLSYQFVISGSAEASGARTEFNEPIGGGMYFARPSFGLGMGSMSMNGVKLTTIGFDPATGGMPKPRFAGGRRNAPKRPVDIPKGWTLVEAKKNITDLETELETTTDDYAKQLETLRGFGLPRGARKAAREQAEAVEEAMGKELGRLSNDLEKANAIYEKLGGDLQAEAKEIRDARALFTFNSNIQCNRRPFISHINATAEQCNQLDELADKYGKQLYQMDSKQKSAYHLEIMAILDAKQQRTFKQLLFRQRWFSPECEQAFSLTKIKLDASKKAITSALSKQLQETNDTIRDNQRAKMMSRRFTMGMAHRMNRDKEFRPYVELRDLFTKQLDEIVGKENAASLLGAPMEHNPKWKRPVIVPAGLSLADAKEQHAEVAAEVEELRAKHERMMEEAFSSDFLGRGGGLPDLLEPGEEEQRRVVKLQRDLSILKRIVEELGGSLDE